MCWAIWPCKKGPCLFLGVWKLSCWFICSLVPRSYTSSPNFHMSCQCCHPKTCSLSVLWLDWSSVAVRAHSQVSNTAIAWLLWQSLSWVFLSPGHRSPPHQEGRITLLCSVFKILNLPTQCLSSNPPSGARVLRHSSNQLLCFLPHNCRLLSLLPFPPYHRLFITDL